MARGQGARPGAGVPQANPLMGQLAAWVWAAWPALALLETVCSCRVPIETGGSSRWAGRDEGEEGWAGAGRRVSSTPGTAGMKRLHPVPAAARVPAAMPTPGCSPPRGRCTSITLSAGRGSPCHGLCVRMCVCVCAHPCTPLRCYSAAGPGIGHEHQPRWAAWGLIPSRLPRPPEPLAARQSLGLFSAPSVPLGIS